jgi:signal transduction histidine kinase
MGMNYDFNLLSYIQFLSGLIAIYLAFFIWKKKFSDGALYLAFFEIAAAIWAIFDAMGSASTTVAHKLFWAQMAYTGITTSGVFFLLFALVYTRKNRFINKKSISFAFVIPCITIALAFTNEFHKILWTEVIIHEPNHQGVYYYGFWFWIHIFYSYTTLSGGIILLLIHGFKVIKIYRIRIWLLLIGTILPFAASIIYVFKLTPIKGDLTPISFIFTGIIVAFSLFRLKMFDIMPIAHKQVIDSLQVGMLVVDPTDRIIDSNPAFDEISKSYDGQKIGCQLDELMLKMNINFKGLGEKNDSTFEALITINGEKKYYDITHHRVLDTRNRLICKIFTFNDITAKKIILDSIAQSNNRRQIELIEKGMLIKDLNAYAHTVAHDLKNPINSLVGFIELIKTKLSKKDIDSAVRFLDILNGESIKMAKIIDELLKLSTIRKEDVKLMPVDNGKILAEALKRLGFQISESKAIINKPVEWPIVMGYPQWIEEVWLNLISNAIKYGGNPPVINLEFEKTSAGTFLFHVKDNGNGLPADSAEKIFEDFERLGRTDVEGHGLGLAIVKRIVEKIGGQVFVSSANLPGEGCIFSFSLPACPDEPAS